MEGIWGSRLCEKCRAPVGVDWDCAYCLKCSWHVCRHNNPPHECNECAVEEDMKFDEFRERHE